MHQKSPMKTLLIFLTLVSSTGMAVDCDNVKAGLSICADSWMRNQNAVQIINQSHDKVLARNEIYRSILRSCFTADVVMCSSPQSLSISEIKTIINNRITEVLGE